jgi:hypothetical protein
VISCLVSSAGLNETISNEHVMHAAVALMTYSCLMSKTLKNFQNPVDKGEMKDERMKC